MATEITRENDRLLTATELAERIGVKYETVRLWRSSYRLKKQGPPWITLGDGPKADVRYPLSDVIAWEDSRRAHDPEEIATVEAEYERQKAS